MPPAAMSRVADLIVILKKDHELLGIESKPATAAAPLLSRVPLSLIEVSPLHSRNQLLRRTEIIGIIIFRVAGHRHAGRVMKIVVPGGVEPEAPFGRTAKQPRILKLVLGHDQRLAPAGGFAHPTADRRQDMIR